MSTIISTDTTLTIADTKNLSPRTVGEIDRQVDDFIARHKNNGAEINRLVFEGAAVLTASTDSSRKMSTQGTLKRFWSRLTGKNSRTQDTINADLAKAQYATQQILQKLADQQLLSFELIATVNDSLNYQMADVNEKILGIKNLMVKFFSGAKQKLEDHEDRIKRLEHNDKLQSWLINIRNWKFDGESYQDLDDAAKMVCIIRDFLKITGDKRYSVDFVYLETALENVGLPLKSAVNVENFILEVGMRRKLYNHLLGEDLRVAEFATEYEPIIFGIREANISASKNFFPVQETTQDFQQQPDDAFTISNRELAFGLLYNLEQVRCAKESQDKYERARELFVSCRISEALPILEELSAAEDERARYLLMLIYNEGINVEKNSERARKLLKANISVGEACSTVYARAETSIGIPAKNYKDACAKLQNPADAIERHALSKVFTFANSHDKALNELKAACEAGFFLATFELGYKYYRGHGVAEDNETARKYFELAAKMNHGQSMFFLGEIYFKGFGVTANPKRAAEWFKKAYDAHAYTGEYLASLGKFYSDNGNFSEALKWYERGAENNEPACLYLAGTLYAYGKGTRKNFSKAANYLKRAIKAGFSNGGDAEDTLGDIYWETEPDKSVAVKWYKRAYDAGTISDGLLVRVGGYCKEQKNYSEAFEWFSRGADKNFPMCLYFVGCAYVIGEGVDKNFSKAAEYLKRAIETGFSNEGTVEDILGDIYWDGGNGISANRSKAVEWYKKACDAGKSSDGLFIRIGDYYRKAEKFSEAFKWYKRGADKNFTYCQMMIAIFYRHGLFVTKDYSEAKRYCERAINSAEQNGYSKSEVVTSCNEILERGFFESLFG